MDKIRSDILIIGGGAAGMSAALAASESGDTSVTLIDDNPKLGGQIWRAELGQTKSPDALRLINAVDAGHIRIVNNAQVFAAVGDKCLIAQTPEGSVELENGKLILATGARERFLPFPGWTLPNVFGAGGLQALVKGGFSVAGKRIVVTGTGPLLLVVAAYLKSKGANVVAIPEQASASKINKFAAGLWRTPAKIVQAAVLRAKLVGTPYLNSCWVTSAAGTDKLEKVELTRHERKWAVDCDILACGFNLMPNTELAALLGCRIENDFVVVDDEQRTSCEDVFCAGEPTGIGGVEASLIEGRIAGLAAAGETARAAELFAKRDSTRQFAAALESTFALRPELKTLSVDETIVCRCEDVTYGRLLEFSDFRDAKLQTRCGMGSCQGRICGSATEFMFGWKPGSIRPPIFPVKMEDL